MVPRLQFAGPILVALAPLGLGQESKALFDAPVIVVDTEERFEELLDFDGDGFQDVVGVWWMNDDYEDITITGYRNDGNGEFIEHWSDTNHHSSSASSASLNGDRHQVLVGDFNGDGRDDVIVGVDHRAYIYRSNQTGSMHDVVVLAEAGSFDAFEDLVAGDFNADGKLDFATYRRIDSAQPGHINIYLNLATQGVVWTKRASLAPVPRPHAEMMAADYDNNGTTDLALVDHLGVVMIEVVDGWLQSSTEYPLLMGQWNDQPPAAFGDVDGDGDGDIVVFKEPNYSVLRHISPGNHAFEPLKVGGPATDLIDVDADGDLDALCCGGGCCHGPDEAHNVATSVFMVSFNDGTGNFTEAHSFPGAGALHLAGAADLEGDGDIDLVAGRCVYYAKEMITPDSLPMPMLGSTYQNTSTLIDYDQDGDPDVEPGLDSLGQNTADGKWRSEAPDVPAAPAGSEFVGPGFCGDFDGDGKLDLVVARKLTSGSFAAMRLLRQMGNGKFEDLGDCGAPGEVFHFNPATAPLPRNGVAADLDLDGDIDLITMPSLPTEVDQLDWPHGWIKSRVYLNDGAGNFTLEHIWQNSRVHEVADLNGDTLPDLVVTSRHLGGLPKQYLRTMKNLGGAQFGFDQDVLQSAVSFTGLVDDAFGFADMNGDGLTDICAPSYDGDINVFYNNGPGMFFTLETVAEEVLFDGVDAFLAGHLHRSVLALDVNDDGRNDLVAFGTKQAPFYARAASAIYLRNPENTGFLPASPDQQVMHGTTVADVDGDGDMDLCGRQLFENHRIEGPLAGSRRQYGVGSPGSGGVIPVLGATGPFRVGETIQVRLRSGVGGSYAQLKFSLTESAIANYPFPGMTGYSEPWFRRLAFPMDGAPGVPGAGGFTLEVTAPAGLAGLTFYHQVYVPDAGAPFGWSSTNGIELSYQ